MRDTHLAIAAAGVAGHRRVPLGRTGAMAGLALHQLGQIEFEAVAEHGLRQVEFEVVAQIRAAEHLRATAAPRATTENVAEHLAKNVAEVLGVETALPAGALPRCVDAGMAMLVTQVATAAAALAWMFAEWMTHGKPSVLGIASGAVAGLVAITPASGTAGPMGALLIGVASGFICFLASTKMKRALGYDDSLDVFGVHAVGGIIGAILTGLCADVSFGGVGLAEGMTIGGQLWVQTKGVLFTLVYTGVLSFVLLKVIDLVIGLRVADEQETEGLDLALHDERGYNL